VWAAKKLRRGELFTAKGAVDGYMKRILLRALEWHARARNPETDTWHGGRFLERWADAQTLAELAQTFAHYDEEDVRAALLATMRLFRRLATETAGLLELPYATDADDYASALVRELLTRCLKCEGPLARPLVLGYQR
jgi:aminoglycoside 6-adenylyltransferase